MNLVGSHAFKVSPQRWNSWRWQLANRLNSAADLENYLQLSDSERQGLTQARDRFAVGITPHMLSLMEIDNSNCPIRRQLIPRAEEAQSHPSDLVDPLGEEPCAAVPGVVHKYPDRVLYLITDHCASYCRYCTRARLVNRGSLETSEATFATVCSYIESHPAIRDVLITGGDPLTLPTELLSQRIARLNSIEHVEMIRLGTRLPTFLPQRINKRLVTALRRAGLSYLSLHFNHPRELTPATEKALALLADGGLVLGNQSVLLRGINDDAQIIKQLNHRLLQNRVTPYYLHLCDSVRGSAHLRTTVQEGIDIIAALRGYTSGYAVPTLALDLPGGGGKVALGPDYLVARDGKNITFKNYQGREWPYREV